MVLFEGSCFVVPCQTRSMGWLQKSPTFNTALSEKNLGLERNGWLARSSLIKVGLLLLRATLKLDAQVLELCNIMLQSSRT